MTFSFILVFVSVSVSMGYFWQVLLSFK